MTFDFHFDDGRHEKHSNWTMWSFAMLMLRHYGVWSEDQLEAELMQLAMKKISQGQINGSHDAKRRVGEDGKDNVMAQKETASNAKRIEKYMKGKTITISVEQIGESEDEDSIVESYAARIDLRTLDNSWIIPLNKAPKFIQEHLADTTVQAVKTAIESNKLTKRLVGLLRDVKIPVDNDLFERLISNDGMIVKHTEAMYLMDVSMQGLKAILTEEVVESLNMLQSDFVSMIGHFAYSAGSGENIQIR